jgi:RND family efflux transporter MFP subunit
MPRRKRNERKTDFKRLRADKMRVSRKIPYWITALILVFIIFWVGYNHKFVKKLPPSGDANSVPLKVIAEAVGTSKVAETIAVTGTFEALTSVEIVPEISGRLEQLRLPDGALIDVAVSVKTADVIAVIEHASLDAAVQQARAALLTAKASLETARVTLADAKREKDRMEGLYIGREGIHGGGVVTQQQYDAACTGYDRAKAGLEVAKANIEQAEAALKTAKVTLDKATIKAPITGIVSKKFVDEGDMVGPSTPLIRIVQMETLKVLGGVSERYLSALVPGKTPVHIKTDTYPQDVFEGTVHRVGVALDPATRTAEVEIRVPNSDTRLKPGMFARMTVVLSEKENVVVVPDSALLRDRAGTYVFIANDTKARRRNVKLGLSQGAYYEVLEGLAAGDVVITHGQGQLEDGQAIQIVEETDK